MKADVMHSTEGRLNLRPGQVGRRVGRWGRGLGLGLISCAALFAAAGCTHKSEAPTPAGPSELGLALTMGASPDVLTLDGQSRSEVSVVARDSNGKLAGNVSMRIEIRYYGSIVDLGTLSSKNITTGSDGRATVMYTAPTGAPQNNSDDGASIVTIVAIPAGYDYANAVTREVNIRLVPQGNILPQAYAPVPKFFFSPQSPGEDQDVRFDGSTSIASCLPDPSDPSNAAKCTPAGGSIVSYQWDFGNGRTGSGAQSDTHYEVAGSYTVKLTVVNDRGLANSTTGSISVTALANPSADFAFSPTTPAVGGTVNFDASASKAVADRSIIQYAWTFGDGAKGSGQLTSHKYDAANTYSVTLTVADSTGRTGTTTKQVTVGAGQAPVSNFVISPTTGTVNQDSFFDGSLSTAPPGRTIAIYEWTFGDGERSGGVRPSHKYTKAGPYAVVLTVTDNTGAQSTSTKTYTVQ
jgi:PKD repeat protein